jgi:hypothetical protein
MAHHPNQQSGGKCGEHRQKGTVLVVAEACSGTSSEIDAVNFVMSSRRAAKSAAETCEAFSIGLVSGMLLS